MDVLVQRLVPDRNRGLLDREPRGRDVEIVSGGEAARIGGHRHFVPGDQRAVAEMQTQIVGFVDAIHRLGVRPGHVRDVHILEIGKHFDQRRAVVHSLAPVAFVAEAGRGAIHIAFRFVIGGKHDAEIPHIVLVGRHDDLVASYVALWENNQTLLPSLPWPLPCSHRKCR